MRPKHTFWQMATILVVAMAALMLAPGCAQDTQAIVPQTTPQVQEQAADQAAQGSSSDIVFNIVNAPASTTLPHAPQPAIELGAATTQPAIAVGYDSDEGGQAAADTRAGYLQLVWLNVQTGGSSTGPQSTAATGSQTASPAANVTQSPEQRPEVSMPIPITVALPGGNASGSASAATGQGQANLTATQTAELQTLMQKVMGGGPDAANAFLKMAEILGVKPGAAPPSTGE